jgi:hypothetical protein
LNLNWIALIFNPADKAMARALTSFRKSMSRKFLILLSMMMLAFLELPTTVSAQVYRTRTHTVTVTVASITVAAVSSSSVALTIDGTGTAAGQNQMTAVNQSTSFLWGTNAASMRVTAATNLGSPKYTLNLVALSPTTGTATAQFTLSTTATNLLTGVGLSKGNCTLQYTGIALASQGTGSDTHTVTFTITP